MADPVLTTLRRKRAEIENAIAAYEKRADEARRDLAAINAAIRIKKPAAVVNRAGLSSRERWMPALWERPICMSD